jgi:hypothetical protein
MNRYRMFFIQTSTLPPRMHQKLTKHGRICQQNNQLPTKSHDELGDNSTMPHFQHSNFLLPICHGLGCPKDPKVLVGLVDITIWVPSLSVPLIMKIDDFRLRAWEIKSFVMIEVFSLTLERYLMRRIILCHSGPLFRAH